MVAQNIRGYLLDKRYKYYFGLNLIYCIDTHQI
jgi:hypothetical protein